MKRLLVLGASISQIPFVKEAKKLGVYVGIVDYNNEAAAIEYADEYFECSLLDLNALRNIVSDFRPNGISCGSSDVGVENCAFLCQEYGFPGLSVETAKKVKDKGVMIEAFRSFGVAHPEYQIIDSLDSKIHIPFPVITKPVDSSGSRGISVARNQEELVVSLRDSFFCSKTGRVVVEEYMIGPEVSVEILVQNGEPNIIQVTDKLTSGEPHFIELGHSQPSMLPDDDITKIKQLAYHATKAVGVENGCCHAEIKLTSQGPKMVEIAGRLGGDFITTILAPVSTGVNMSKYEILRSLGVSQDYKIVKNDGRGVAVRFIESRPGKVEKVEVNFQPEMMKGIEEMKIVCKTDKMYGKAVNNNDRFGYVIASDKNVKQAIKRCERALSCFDIKME